MINRIKLTFGRRRGAEVDGSPVQRETDAKEPPPAGRGNEDTTFQPSVDRCERLLAGASEGAHLPGPMVANALRGEAMVSAISSALGDPRPWMRGQLLSDLIHAQAHVGDETAFFAFAREVLRQLTESIGVTARDRDGVPSQYRFTVAPNHLIQAIDDLAEVSRRWPDSTGNHTAMCEAVQRIVTRFSRPALDPYGTLWPSGFSATRLHRVAHNRYAWSGFHETVEVDGGAHRFANRARQALSELLGDPDAAQRGRRLVAFVEATARELEPTELVALAEAVTSKLALAGLGYQSTDLATRVPVQFHALRLLDVPSADVRTALARLQAESRRFRFDDRTRYSLCARTRSVLDLYCPGLTTANGGAVLEPGALEPSAGLPFAAALAMSGPAAWGDGPMTDLR